MLRALNHIEPTFIQHMDTNAVLDGKYARITGSFASAGTYSGTTSIKIFGDSVLLGEFSNTYGDYPIYIDLTIIGVNTLTIDCAYTGVFYNIELTKFN